MLLTQQGPHYRYEPPSRRGMGALEFWAENGMVIMVDERFPFDDEKSLEVLTVREFLQNMYGINMSIGRIANHNSSTDAAGHINAGGSAMEEREALHRLVEAGITCVKLAKSQGRPDDPQHLAQISRERRKHYVLGGAAKAAATVKPSQPAAGLLFRERSVVL